MSHRFEAQFFSVVGPAYIPEHAGLSRVEAARPRIQLLPADRSRRRGLEALAVVAVLIAGIVVVAGDVVAAVRHDRAAGLSQRTATFSLAGGTAPVRW